MELIKNLRVPEYLVIIILETTVRLLKNNHLTKEDLFKRFNELSRKRTIQFTIGNTVSKISSYRQEILDKTKYRYIFIPKGDESILGSDYLFAIDFINNVPELIDKIDSEKPRYCKVDIHNSKIQIRRKDKNGYLWSEEKVEYTNDTTLIAQLSKFDKEVKEKETVIAIPDLKEESSFKSKRVEVFYLNAGGKDDTHPFLIVFDKEGNGKREKAYHFKDTYNFKDWKEFNVETSETLEKKLEEKLEKIDKYCACLSNITTVRWYAHQILIGQKPPPPKPEEKTTPTRPPEVRPPDEPEPLPVWLIVGCVAAGVVLIVTSVVVYGIYWYNTTIKLLT
nr:hypothetical protein MACL_00000422 [Theileria orientalis]